MHTIQRSDYENQTGLEFLSEGIAMVEILGRALMSDMPMDTSQARHGVAIMLDHIAVTLSKAEKALTAPY